MNLGVMLVNKDHGKKVRVQAGSVRSLPVMWLPWVS
jgi:hypothetical protein